MKTPILLSLSFLILIAGLGCGSGSSTEVVAADGTKATVNKDDGSMNVQTPDGGSASMGGGTKVTEDDVHMPFYPGSTDVEGRAFKMDSPTEQSAMSVRSTADDPQKVADFYTAKVKDLKFNKFEANGATNFMAESKAEDGSKFAITISKKASEATTEITIAYGLEKKK
ncbi:MAG: hypothetical protein J0L72_02880 [Armatimonadetes bacterium]|nr:hypothetical protein [Armatimonadota bacterium]